MFLIEYVSHSPNRRHTLLLERIWYVSYSRNDYLLMAKGYIEIKIGNCEFYLPENHFLSFRELYYILSKKIRLTEESIVVTREILIKKLLA